MEWRTSRSVAYLSSHSRHSYHQCPVVVNKKENELIVKHSGITCGSVFEDEMICRRPHFQRYNLADHDWKDSGLRESGG